MSATIAQTTTIDPVNTTGLDVKFERALLIKVPVEVFPPIAGDNKPIFVVPTVTIPGTGLVWVPARCVVIWTLVDSTNAFSTLGFANKDQLNGIQIPLEETPLLGFSIVDSGLLYAGADPKQWRIEVMNQVARTNSRNYDINIEYTLPSAPGFLRFAIHDPTIVVTPEPIG